VRAEVERIARAFWPIAAGLLLGLAIGGVWTLLQSDRYAAKAHVTLSGGPASRLAPAVETLANGSVVEQNVKQTLRLSGPPDLSASVDNNIVEVRAEAGSPERARQVDAEAVQVLTQLVAARFGSQGLQATLLDPAHVTEQTSPTAGRNLLICGLLGLVVGGGLVYGRLRRRAALPVGSGAVDPNLEYRLKKRVDEVTKRERALARRAGELAKREAELEQRRGQLDEQESLLAERDAELGATKKQLAERAGSIAASERELEARAAVPPPPAEPKPAPAPAAVAVAPAPAATRVGSWNVNELQRAIDSQSNATAEQIEEWMTYLFFLREHAAVDGSLPPQFDGLVEDIFGEMTR
jgi:hypothetical protein